LSGKGHGADGTDSAAIDCEGDHIGHDITIVVRTVMTTIFLLGRIERDQI